MPLWLREKIKTLEMRRLFRPIDNGVLMVTNRSNYPRYLIDTGGVCSEHGAVTAVCVS